MDENWCLEKLGNLRIKENRVEALSEIRHHLNDAASLEDVATATLLKSSEIYECLEDNTASEQCNLAIDILSICMSHLSINQIDLPNLLERSLKHQKAGVRGLALNTILKELQKKPHATVQQDLIRVVVECLQEHDAAVGVPTVGILSIVLKHKLDNSNIKDILLQKLELDDTVRCRIYEIAVNLAKVSPSHLRKIEEILIVALTDLERDDILLQLNIMEIFVSLAEQNHGLVFLEQKRVFEKISKRVDEMEQKPFNHMLVPGIMKFFGKIAYYQPQKIIVGYPNMVQCLFSCLHSSDPSILPIAFDTLGNLAHSQQGKLLLEEYYAQNLQEIFEDFLSYIKNLPTELKNRAFNALQVIFSSEEDIHPKVSEILEKWYNVLAGGENLQFLIDYSRNPFPDIKVACLQFILTLSGYKWGVLALKNTAGFVEYLLDRRVEFNKDAKLVKFEIVQKLSKSSVFDVQTQLQLKKYVNEGPYYVQVLTEIAVEGN